MDGQTDQPPTAVVDSYALYSVAAGHRPCGSRLSDLAYHGGARLVTSSLALAVATGMRDCGDDTCAQPHPADPAAELRRLLDRGEVEVVDLTGEQAVTAGTRYAACVDQRVVGAAVLAACHSLLLAECRALPLLSTVRASYCYVPLADTQRQPIERYDGPASAADDPARWLKRLGPTEGELELVCFPHSGGAASVFRPLAVELAGQARVVGVQYPGRQDRHTEPVLTDLHELADRIAGVLRRTESALPRVFLGHSMGAILAYEVARRLGADGPATLIVSGRPAPSRVRLTTSYRLPDDELAAQVSWLGGTAAEVLAHPDLRELLLPVIRGDYQASETYRQRSTGPLDCAVLALAGREDPVTSVADVRAWSAHTTGPFGLETFAGGHFFPLHNWPAIAGLVLASQKGTHERRQPVRS